MDEQYEMVAIKRKWVPNWLFAIFAYHDLGWPLPEIDLIACKWLPFRFIFVKELNKET